MISGSYIVDLKRLNIFYHLQHLPSEAMSLARAFYTGVTKRTSTFALGIIVGAFVFERTIDWGIDYAWETHNKGKLWKDIKHKYETE